MATKRFATSCALKQNFERAPSVLQALAGFRFAEQALMNCFAAHIIDAVGGLEKGRVDADELEVVIDLVQQIAEGGRGTITARYKAGKIGRKFLLHGFLHDGPAHYRAGSVETIEVTAGGFVEITVGFFRRGRSDNALAQMRGARGCGLNERNQLKGDSRAEQVVLVRIECSAESPARQAPARTDWPQGDG